MEVFKTNRPCATWAGVLLFALSPTVLFPTRTTPVDQSRHFLMERDPKLPPGCSIEWVKESAKQSRLLDWLDNNPVERACLFFEPSEPKSPSRTKCATKAAHYVFQNDENPKNSAGVVVHPAPFAAAIVRLISRGPSSWKTRYEKVNKTLGPVASKLPYSEFQRGSNIQRKAAEEIKKFPQWERLHVYWRTSSHFNPFVNKKPDSSSGSRGRAAMKRKAVQDESEVESEDDPTSDLDIKSEDEEAELVTARQKKHRITVHSPSDDGQLAKKRARRFSNASMGKTVTLAAGQQHNDVFDSEETTEDGFGSQLTADQRFQLHMAQLRYKTQREENVARQQEQTQRVLMALLDAVKH